MTPPLPYYPAVMGFREDVATARRLLAEAGYPNGDGFPRLTIQCNTHQHHKRIAEYIQQKWNENLGIEVELINKEWKVFVSSLTTGDYQVSRAGWIGSYLDPITFLDMWVTGSALNTGGWYQECPGPPSLEDHLQEIETRTCTLLPVQCYDILLFFLHSRLCRYFHPK